jgi:hypothetical protein
VTLCTWRWAATAVMYHIIRKLAFKEALWLSRGHYGEARDSGIGWIALCSSVVGFVESISVCRLEAESSGFVS